MIISVWVEKVQRWSRWTGLYRRRVQNLGRASLLVAWCCALQPDLPRNLCSIHQGRRNGPLLGLLIKVTVTCSMNVGDSWHRDKNIREVFFLHYLRMMHQLS